ncbi:hypothetical protein BGZ57DRAFT_1003826 [Hyaloscypha finlandica]|nr:hypothetical protein BGZ57DRAFT_1003826 [Hyaloscypha finlandica]
MHRYGKWPPAGPEDDNTSGWQHLRNHSHTALSLDWSEKEASNQIFARNTVSLPVIRSVSLGTSRYSAWEGRLPGLKTTGSVSNGSAVGNHGLRGMAGLIVTQHISDARWKKMAVFRDEVLGTMVRLEERTIVGSCDRGFGKRVLGLAPTPANCKIHGRVLRTKFEIRLAESGDPVSSWNSLRYERENYLAGRRLVDDPVAKPSERAKGIGSHDLDSESRAAKASVHKEEYYHPAVQLFVVAQSRGQKFNMSAKRSGLDETKALT